MQQQRTKEYLFSISRFVKFQLKNITSNLPYGHSKPIRYTDLDIYIYNWNVIRIEARKYQRIKVQSVDTRGLRFGKWRSRPAGVVRL